LSAAKSFSGWQNSCNKSSSPPKKKGKNYKKCESKSHSTPPENVKGKFSQLRAKPPSFGGVLKKNIETSIKLPAHLGRRGALQFAARWLP